ncbi:MAG: DUF4097 family beta strand repeat protein [Acidobacteria bacterium]|nr:DUF4097 family beta strand repeat protein [Acidobacteriota bacterium]MCG3192958.1 hypothetical protein [Thermoanaerobaculia bacterium]MCK6681990.1 DUF4097 family beta strand repeat-containing protein [Thermoanaerobaculia bacterium]
MVRVQNNKIAVRAASAVILSLALVSGGALSAEQQSERFEKAYELTGIKKIRLQNINGSVQLVSWERDYLKVEALKRARGSRAEQVLKETEIRVTKSGETIEIETVLPKQTRLFGIFPVGMGDSGAEVAYDLHVPADVPIDVETVNGRIETARRTGTLSLNTVNGSILVVSHDAPLSVNTVNGSVEVSFVGTLKPAEIETVNGSVTVSCGRESSIRYDLQTVNGKIRSDFAGMTVEGKWGPKEAKGVFNGGRDRLAVETVNGEVRLLFADAAIPKAPPRP